MVRTPGRPPGIPAGIHKKVDPVIASTSTGVLAPKRTVTNPEKIARGRLVDDHGLPLRDSVVQPVGLSTKYLRNGKPANGEISEYGDLEGVDPITVTDEKGEFDIDSQRPALGLLLKFETRGFAPKLAPIPTGPHRTTVTMSRGAVVRGRLLNHGAPVAAAEVGLIPRNRGGFSGHLKIVGNPYDEIRVGTQADGSFVLADVPLNVGWYLYPKMESLSGSLAAPPLELDTKVTGDILNVGDIQLNSGLTLKGKIVLPNHQHIPDGMRVTIAANLAWDSQVVPIHQDGGFECSRLPAGTYEIIPSVKGYRLPARLDNVTVDRDVDGLTISLVPDSQE